LHNPRENVYDFRGIADLEKFLQLATDEGLFIILRPGPYTSAGIDNGGIPHWLATKYPDIRLRTTDQNFLNELEKWFSVLLPVVRPHLLMNGGNILMVEVEHEYGALKICDKSYKNLVKSLIERILDSETFLFTTDRPEDKEIPCGAIENVYATTNFGISDNAEIMYYFVSYLQEVQTSGPMMNSQLFPGERNYWQKPTELSPIADDEVSVASTVLDTLLSFDNFNIDSFQVGTNFGFFSGAVDHVEGFKPVTGSCDVNSAQDEIGNPRENYETIANALSFVS
jgi:beta-galactosidase